jgi:hypothetical protein
MNIEVTYLKELYPDAQVWESCVKNYICVRRIISKSQFYKSEKGKKDVPFSIDISDTQHLHVDTVRLMRFNDM